MFELSSGWGTPIVSQLCARKSRIPTLERLEHEKRSVQGSFAHTANRPLVVRDALHNIEQLFHANETRLQDKVPEIWMKPNLDECNLRPNLPAKDITNIDWFIALLLGTDRALRSKSRLPAEVFKAKLLYRAYSHMAIQLRPGRVLDDGLGYN
ncbi:hypothetical protein ACOSQ4_030676 [Xanthoceras sorbifolium]